MDGSDDNDLLDGLEERLNSHSRAFESLLALTPARDYYGSHIVDGQDPSEQWNRKKQTKEEKRAAKRAKLDPANQKSALDIIKEREAEALKRKRNENEGPETAETAETAETSEVSKRQKSEADQDTSEARRREIVEKKREYRARKKERKEAKKAKADAKKARKHERALTGSEKLQSQPDPDGEIEEDDPDDDSAPKADEIVTVDISGLTESKPNNELVDKVVFNADTHSDSSIPSTPTPNSPTFDVGTNHSATSSSSSIVPPSTVQTKQSSKQNQAVEEMSLDTPISIPDNSADTIKTTDHQSGGSTPKLQLPNIDHSILQERLRQRIAELRAARKADGGDGRPAKSRSELLEQRRKKEELRKAAKKEQIRKAKEEERRKQEERLRGSGSPLSTDMFSPLSPQARENNFAFSRLAFEDGTFADADLGGLQEAKRRKGPQDAKTALQAAKSKEARIAGLDAAKRADIEEKDTWLNAKKRTQGERVRDDTSLLKKALKRKEKQKNKSETQWKEREDAVVKGKEMKQKKREANLQKRREEKGGKGKKKGVKVSTKRKARPGFEGRLKA